jgi:stage II sporulation protein AA (anti-sigma F factor antagonist)
MDGLTPRFDVRVESMIDGVSRVTVWGEVDPVVSEMLFEFLVCALSVDGVRHITVDLANVTLLDASGIGVLLAAQNRADMAGKVLSVCNATGLPLQALQITGALERLHGKSAGEDHDSRSARSRRWLQHGR